MKRTLFCVGAFAAMLLGIPALAPAQFPVTIAHAHPNMNFDPAVFTQWMDFLVANDYHTVTPDQFYEWLVNDEPMPIRPVLLTFDDNYIRVYTEVFPVLQARGQTAVNFAHTNYVGVPGANDHCDWNEIAEMEADGAVLTESHTLNHVDLTVQSPTDLHDEVTSSKLAIEAHLPGTTCYHIAYPYGRYNATVIAACQAAGYRMGYTTVDGFNYHDTPLFEIRRIPMDGVDLETFKTRIGFYNLPPAPPGEGWTIDNTDVNFFRDSSAWTVSTSGTGYYGTDFATHTPGDGSKPALWAAYLPTGGSYKVYARWPAASGNASDATFRISDTYGTRDVPADFQSNGGKWNLLGTFTFSTTSPARVELLDAGNGTLVADGVWFEPVNASVEGWMLF